MPAPAGADCAECAKEGDTEPATFSCAECGPLCLGHRILLHKKKENHAVTCLNLSEASDPLFTRIQAENARIQAELEDLKKKNEDLENQLADERAKADPEKAEKDLAQIDDNDDDEADHLTGMGGRGRAGAAPGAHRSGRRASVAQGVAGPPRTGAVRVAVAR
jgi:hypothetical protein